MQENRIRELELQIQGYAAENAELRQAMAKDEFQLLIEISRAVTALTKRVESIEGLVGHLIDASDDMRTQTSAVRAIAERLFEVVDGLNESIRKLPCKDEPDPCLGNRDTERPPPELRSVAP
jgi:methyl-accepting chemotaxis protein